MDLGSEWVHGAKNNVVYELASPYDLLERTELPFISWESIFIDSKGNFLKDEKNAINNFLNKYVISSDYCVNTTYKSTGDCIIKK